MKLDIKTISLYVSVTIASTGAVFGAIKWFNHQVESRVLKETEDKAILNQINNQVIPRLEALSKAKQRQDSALNEIGFRMATKEQINDVEKQIKALQTNQGVLIKHNKSALQELKELQEIKELTQEKADAYDEIKKN